jgi:hypothetical protein
LTLTRHSIQIPINEIIDRLENLIFELQEQLENTPLWQVRKYWILRGAIAALQFELDHNINFEANNIQETEDV